MECYNSILDILISRIEERFEENDRYIIQCIEKIIMVKSTSSIAYTILQEIASFYDLNFEDLKAEMYVF